MTNQAIEASEAGRNRFPTFFGFDRPVRLTYSPEKIRFHSQLHAKCKVGAQPERIPHFLTSWKWNKFERFEECCLWSSLSLSSMIRNAMAMNNGGHRRCSTFYTQNARQRDICKYGRQQNWLANNDLRFWIPKIKGSAHWNANLIARSIGVSIAWKKNGCWSVRLHCQIQPSRDRCGVELSLCVLKR